MVNTSKFESKPKFKGNPSPIQHRVPHRNEDANSAGLPGCAQNFKGKAYLASVHNNQVQGGKFLLRDTSNHIISNTKPPARNTPKTIKSSCSDSNNFSPFHLLKEKFLRKAHQKDKEKSASRKEVSLFTNSDAERDNLNLSAHRETLSVFYPNVRSVEHRGAFGRREPILSSHPSMLSAFYTSLIEHDEKIKRK